MPAADDERFRRAAARDPAGRRAADDATAVTEVLRERAGLGRRAARGAPGARDRSEPSDAA